MKPSVLIIDDDIEILEILSDEFLRSGFNAVTCTSGEEAEQVMSDRNFDAVIIDEILPGKRGSDLIPFACASVDVVIFITGSHSFDSALAYRKDANIVIRKPFKAEDVVNAAIRYLKDDAAGLPKRDSKFFNKFNLLTERERQVLEQISEGLVASEIGRRLGISPQTVFKHRASIKNKFDGLKLLQICKILNL